MAGAVGIFAFAGAMGVTGSIALSAAIAVVVAGLAGTLVWRYPVVTLDSVAASRPLRIVSGIATIAALVLAFVTVSKLFPGLLIVYLLVRRDWRAIGWTIVAAVALVAVSILDTGWAPYQAFLDHLPGLVGGEAFPAFRNPGAVAKNYSVPGMVFKLGLFGLPGASFVAMKVVGWIYTLVILAVTIVIARRTLTRDAQPLVWLAILTLATLRSPFLPPYAAFPPLWLLTLLAARYAATTRTMMLVLLSWVAVNVAISQNDANPQLISLVLLIPQAATVAITVLALRATRRHYATASLLAS